MSYCLVKRLDNGETLYYQKGEPGVFEPYKSNAVIFGMEVYATTVQGIFGGEVCPSSSV